jgi:hypothetical protein
VVWRIGRHGDSYVTERSKHNSLIGRISMLRHISVFRTAVCTSLRSTQVSIACNSRYATLIASIVFIINNVLM